MIDSEALKCRYQWGVDIPVVYTLNYVHLFWQEVGIAASYKYQAGFCSEANALNEPPGNYDVQD